MGLPQMETNSISGSISVFFPAFNDAHAISPLILSALDVLPTLTDDYEVLVVNDGSTDATRAVLDEMARSCAQLRVIHHQRNLGYGAALRSGFSHATKDLIFYTDGDGQYDVREFPVLHSELSADVDVVNGFKAQRADALYRRLLGGLFNSLVRQLFRLPIRDVDCDFRLLRRSALDRISLEASSGAICVELVHKLKSAGCVFREVPVHHYQRSYGRSQFFTPRRVAHTLADLFAFWLSIATERMSRRVSLLSPYPRVKTEESVNVVLGVSECEE
jgi:glycosyltransferase involved in cell wall biosynthesis